MKIFAHDIKENDDVDSIFLVKEKASGLTKTGNSYLKLKLGDRSGEMEGRIWNSVELFVDVFQKDDFVRVKGKAVSFQDHLQLNIHHIESIREDGVEVADFFPTTEKNVDDMIREIMEVSGHVQDPHLARLLQLFWEDASFVEKFTVAPASKQLHHAHLGGLLEHTLSVTQLVILNVNHYPGVNPDLLLAGAILHDLGKVQELSYERSFGYSDEGKLLGHIILGLEMVEEKIHQISDFPKELSTLLKHLLISHHGQFIWGSPKKPATLEALFLHYLDDMDAKMNGIWRFLKTKVPEGSKWSPFHPLFDQSFYHPPAGEQVEGVENMDKNDPDSKR